MNEKQKGRLSSKHATSTAASSGQHQKVNQNNNNNYYSNPSTSTASPNYLLPMRRPNASAASFSVLRLVRQNPIASVLFLIVVYLAATRVCPQHHVPSASDKNQHCLTAPVRYSIMMDAGSTGSRTHVYQFNADVITGKLKLTNEVFQEVRPGLSSYKEDADAAAKSLVPLMDLAVKSVPEEYRVCTPVALKATAGLRLLGEAKSAAILEKVGALLRSYPFTVGSDAAIVMDASDEGPYAWLTVNFLLGNVKPGNGKTAAIMDMGGASTQVVFAPDDVSVLNAAPKDYVYGAKVAGAELRAYQHSFLGLGLKEAGRTLVKAAAAVGGDFVCFPKGHTQEVDGKTVTNTGASNFEECVTFVREHLVRHATDDADCASKACPFRGVHLPDMTTTFHGPVYAFSYFYDRMEPFFVSDEETFTVSSFKTVGRQLCESTEDKYASKNLGTMCMDFSFLYSILRYGYKLEDARELLIKKKIDGYETAWALGASLTAMGEF